MIRPNKNLNDIYIYRDPVDFRKQVNGLMLIVQEELYLDVYGSSLFVFTNKQRNKIKILCWDKTGFILYYKRLEQDRFKWPKLIEAPTLSVNGEQLNWLLDGIDLKKINPHKPLFFNEEPCELAL